MTHRILPAAGLMVLICSVMLGAQIIDTKSKSEPEGTGKKVTTERKYKNGDVEVEVEHRDATGKLTKKTKEITAPNGDITREEETFDCNEKIQTRHAERFEGGRKTFNENETYVDGKLVSGLIDIDMDGRPKVYNPKTEQYEPLVPGDPAPSPLAPFVPRCDPLPELQVIGSAVILREDFDTERFSLYGLGIEATYFLSPTLGVTADVTRTSKTFDTVSPPEDVTKTALAGGVTLLPFRQAGRSDPLTVSVHALAGLHHVGFGQGANHFSSNGFVLKFGAALDYHINHQWIVRPLRFDYAPVFRSGVTRQNFAFSFGGGAQF